MKRTLIALLAASSLFVPAVLLADGEGLARQLALGSATAAMLLLATRRLGVDARQIATAVVVATTGEVILSVGLGLYDYRFATIPFYVPPGHGLFYALAAASARELGPSRHAGAIVRGVLVAGTAVAVAGIVSVGDVWGALWWAGAALLIARSSNALLLAVCCSYTMLLEWLGTSMGNWTWASEVLGMRSGNPPSGVGILYVVLDLVTVAICTASGRGSASTQALQLPAQPADDGASVLGWQAGDGRQNPTSL